MSQFEDAISSYYDSRLSTLAGIKARSLGADVLVLSALRVLAYAQLEGGVKDASACVIRHVNARKMGLGDIAPSLLKWRNIEEVDRLRALVNFEMIGLATPFGPALGRRVRINPINRRHELNQMTWAAVKKVYSGLGLDCAAIQHCASGVDDLVAARNEVAHYGSVPKAAAALVEGQVRANVATVEDVLTDLSLQLLSFFSKRLHARV
jgi:hypothetical protein